MVNNPNQSVKQDPWVAAYKAISTRIDRDALGRRPGPLAKAAPAAKFEP